MMGTFIVGSGGTIAKVLDEARDECTLCVGEDWCLAENPTDDMGMMGLVCTLAEGHDGQHAGCGVVEHPIARW